MRLRMIQIAKIQREISEWKGHTINIIQRKVCLNQFYNTYEIIQIRLAGLLFQKNSTKELKLFLNVPGFISALRIFLPVTVKK